MTEPAPDPSEPAPDEPEHEETAIESSILGPIPTSPLPGDGLERRGPPPLRFFITIGVVAVVIGALGFAAAVRAQRLQAALAAFERVLVEGTPEEALQAARALPAAVRDDPNMATRIQDLEKRVAARAYLAQVGDFRTGLRKTKSYADRIAFCDQALTAEVEPIRVKAERVRAAYHQRLALVRSGPELDVALAKASEETGEAGILNDDPPWGRFVLARIRRRAQGLRGVAQDLKGVTTDPGSALGNLILGLRHELADRDQAALSAYGRGIQLEPFLADGYMLRGALRLRRGNQRGAREDAIKARELDPLSAEAWLLLAETHLRAGERAIARRQVTALLQAYPYDGAALGFSAYLDATSADPQRKQGASTLAARAAALNPANPWSPLARATAALDSGKLQLARGAIDPALRTRPRLEGYLLRARYNLAMGRPTQALQDLTLRVLRRDPKNVEGLLLSIRARVLARQYREALRLVARLQTVRETAEGYFWQGRIHVVKRPQNLRMANEALTQAIALDPKHAAAYAYRAEALLRLRRYVSALKDLEQAKKLGVGTAMPAWSLMLTRAQCHQALGEKDAAVRAYRNFVASAPRSHAKLSWARMQLRRLLR